MRWTARKLMPTRLGHGPAGPVGRLAKWIRAGQGQHLGHGRCGQSRLAGWPRLVAQEAIDTFFAIAPLPAPDRRPADARPAGDLKNRHRSADSNTIRAR
jgi:hypothetical protein